MAAWNDGYVTDVTYSTGYHRETSPSWMATSATLLGLNCPDLTRPFRYADLGCGNGVTALVVAATMPHAQIWGFDFNPAHIDAARDMARRAGLSNVHFEEASFEDLTRAPPAALPMFDYISAHGVLSWVSLENRRRLFSVIGQRLLPGGIAYVSYNVATGWTGMPPLRTLMRLLTEAGDERSDRATATVFETVERMKQAGAAMFQVHGLINQLMVTMRGQNPRYVAHELLNRNWFTVMFQSVAAAMAGIKCDYVGSASLQDNLIGLTVPPPLREMFTKLNDTASRETLRDLGSANGFRRDLYQRGARWLTPAEHLRRVDALGLARTFRPLPEPLTMPSPLGEFTISDPLYRSLLHTLEEGPMTIGQLRALGLPFGVNPGSPREAAMLLLHHGYLDPSQTADPDPVAVATASRLNQILAEAMDDGDDVPFVAVPALGAAWQIDPFDMLALDETRINPDAQESDLVAAVVARMKRIGRLLNQDGQPLTQPAAVHARVTSMMADFVRHRLPMMRRLGTAAGSAAITEVS